MDTTTSASLEDLSFDWESGVAAPILSIEHFGIPIVDDPLGRAGGKPGLPDQQRVIIQAVVETGARITVAAAWGVSRLPSAWDADGNRDRGDLVVDVYRVDNAIRGTVLVNLSEHRDNLVGQEQDFSIRCAC